ncbi:ankyrin repeat-containing domain protein [Penicillium canariense]|uniref:Ankyrin repeat-containing domain protein n=1 Tax=Penicillium canariense TaxID=189055 RepID=A0A9W9LPE6_9EURO|nr:ankyrin repeat-containing domain protein [Penicillium canariense]KAJ5168116.1 ankyrin repeat-containing domain protein [Penicillium canariense]
MPDTRRQDAMSKLSSGYDHDDNHHGSMSDRTGSWFFEDARVKRWRDTNQSSILWLTSSPGQGKSVLAKALATQAGDWWGKGHLAPETHTTVTYYFFRDGHARRMTAASAVCAQLHHLFGKSPYPAFIEQTWAQLPTGREAGNLLKEPLSDFDKVWPHFVRCARDARAGHFVCVLDAVDECESSERTQLLRAIAQFYSEDTGLVPGPASIVKLLVTSCSLEGGLKRDFEELRDAAGAGVTTLIGIDELNHRIQLDMEPTINGVLDHLQGEQQQRARHILRGNETKSWLWLRVATSLILNTLKAETDGSSPFASVDTLLGDFPTDVDGVYQKALDMTTAKWGAPLVDRMLHVLLAVQRPLSSRELLSAIEFSDADPVAAISTPHRRFYGELARRHPEQNDLLMGILDGVLLRNQQTVTIIHKSARDFLLRRNETPSPALPNASSSWRGRVDMALGHEMLTRACLFFLLTLKMKSYVHYNEHKYKKPKVQRNMRREERRAPFLRYAAQYWPIHYNSQPKSAAEAALDPVRVLCTGDGPERNNWMYLYSGYGGWWWSDIDVAAHLGIVPLVREILDKLRGADGAEDPARDPDSWHNWPRRGLCPLYKAVGRGDIRATRILFDHGFILRPGCECDRSLTTAAGNGNTQLVRLLLNRGASISWESEFGGTALADACHHGHADVVKLLLDRGANVNTGFSNIGLASRNPLEAAAYGGYLWIVRVLLDRGIDAQSSGIKALWEAAGEGHKEVVRLLLAKGVAPNVSCNSLSGSALCRAVRYGHREIVQALLDHGAQVLENEMKEAFSKGNDDIVELLMDPYISLLLS